MLTIDASGEIAITPEALIQNLREAGFEVSAEEEMHIRMSTKLMPLVDRGVLHRAVAEDFYKDGFNNSKLMDQGLRGFRGLGIEERVSIIDNIFELLKVFAGANLSRAELVNLDARARAAGFSNTDQYVEFVRSAILLLQSDETEIKSAIYLLFERRDRDFINSVIDQLSFKEDFGKVESITLAGSVPKHIGKTVSETVTVGKIFRRRTIPLEVRREVVEAVNAKWTLHGFTFAGNYRLIGQEETPWIINMRKLAHAPANWSYDDIQYIFANPPKIIRDGHTLGQYGGIVGLQEKALLDLLESVTSQNKLPKPFTESQISNLFSSITKTNSRLRLMQLLRTAHPNEPLYQKILVK